MRRTIAITAAIFVVATIGSWFLDDTPPPAAPHSSVAGLSPEERSAIARTIELAGYRCPRVSVIVTGPAPGEFTVHCSEIDQLGMSFADGYRLRVNGERVTSVTLAD